MLRFFIISNPTENHQCFRRRRLYMGCCLGSSFVLSTLNKSQGMERENLHVPFPAHACPVVSSARCTSLHNLAGMISFKFPKFIQTYCENPSNCGSLWMGTSLSCSFHCEKIPRRAALWATAFSFNLFEQYKWFWLSSFPSPVAANVLIYLKIASDLQLLTLGYWCISSHSTIERERAREKNVPKLNCLLSSS